MRLSMWMIANRLNALEPEVSIRDDSPMELCGVRNFIATNCAHIYRKKHSEFSARASHGGKLYSINS